MGGRRIGTAGAVLLAVMGMATGTAHAVFPGAAGRLDVNAQLFDPPADFSAPVLSFSPMHHVRFSPDGTKVVGVVGLHASATITVANADGSDQHAITTPPANGDGDSHPTWSPDGTEVAFVRSPRIPCGTSTCIGSQLVVVDVETHATRDLTAPSYGFYQGPDWSPDPTAHELVDITGGATPFPVGVNLIDADSGTLVRNLFSPTSFPAPMAVRFAPDAQSVVVGFGAPEDPPDAFRVQTFPLDGSAGVSFPVKGAVPTPTFTPDGLWVTFGDCRPGCGFWSRSLPTDTDPGGTYREDVSTSYSSAPGGTPIDWEPLVDTPVITAGPAGRTRETDATFEFAIPSTQVGTYQCRLDGGGWEDGCTSPKSYGGLGDGDHEFDVRFYLHGQSPDDAPIARRGWTVDTTAPQAIVDQAPSGSTTSTDATIVFHSTEPDGATFRCSVDGGPEADCSSPLRLAGLAIGPHAAAVKAVDDVGNVEQSAARVSWEVTLGSGGGGGGAGGADAGGATGPAPLSSCGSGGGAKVAAGAVVALGRFGTCFVRTREADGSIHWTAAGPFTLNGVQITPAGVATLVQKLSSVSVELPRGTTLGFGSFTWTLPFGVDVPVSVIGSGAHFLLPNNKQAFKIAGLPVAGKVDFQLATSEGGSSTVSVELELPEILQGAAGNDTSAQSASAPQKDAKKLAIAFKFIASNDKGVRFTFKGSVSNAWLFGKARLSSLSVGLDQGPPLVFEGSATLTFPGVRDGKFAITLGLSDQGAASFPNVTKLALQASELQKPIADGVFLQRLGGQFARCVGSDGSTGGELSANAGVSFGPKLTIPHLFDGEPASLDGMATLSLCEPKSFVVSGAGKIVEVSVGSASAKYTWSKSRVDLTGQLDLTIGGWGFTASIDNAFFDMAAKQWNVAATGQLRLPRFVGGGLNGQGDVVLSSNGLAACFGRPGHQAGIAKHWGQDLQKFFDSCDVGPYRAGAARASQLGAPQPVTIPRDDPVALLAVHGAAAPPRISVAGPGGARFDMPGDGGALQTASALLVPDVASSTTYVVLFAPAAGTWTITPDPLTVGGTSVQVADGRPAVHVTARVLTWRVRRIAGQQVTFVEHGESTDRVLGVASRANGRLRFTPAPGPGGRRQVIALVTEHGLPRTKLVVAHLAVPRPPRLVRVRGLVRRAGSVRWRPQPTAAGYSVLLRAASGATFATTTRQPGLRVPPALRRMTLTVTVSALDATDRAGPVASRTLPA